jgi:superfamily I DNA/RNA helicase
MERWVEAEDIEETIGEVQVAEYIVFLLALDTYMRYAEEATGDQDLEDDTIRRGLRILRLADSNLESLASYFDAHLPSPTHKAMLRRAVLMPSFNPAGASRRALQFRTLLSRGGASTMKGVFATSKYIRQVKEAISASMLDDADRALDVFAAIPMHNARMRAWVDLAAKVAGSGEAAPSAVDAGSREASGESAELIAQTVKQIAATGADEAREAQEAQAEILATVEREASAAARRSMEINQEVDEPPLRSEVVGVAVAAATAAMSDPSKPQNVPAPLRKLDDEQRAAALTDGKVGVFAGAGAGKSTTLVARVEYLVKERRVLPSRILVTSFNNKAATELKEKIGKAVGGADLQQMTVGTMHSLFRRLIGEYGTPEERTMMGTTRGGANGFIEGGNNVAFAVQRIWEECFSTKRPPPKLKMVRTYQAQWSGNHVTPAQAKQEASGEDEAGGDKAEAAQWYEMYEGLKGSIPGWKPPCVGKQYESFMARFRPNNIRLGDFSDMLTTFREVLLRNPAVAVIVQKMYDHIIVDEAQDRNAVMVEILDMLTAHITDGSDGKSYWVVGDDKQAINSFMGARADLFTDIYEKEGWKTRVIRTNYRCEPEIVDCANQLIAHNDGQIPMAAVAAPQKALGVGSIRVESPVDEVSAALSVVETIKGNLAMGQEVTDHAILCRTNKELHAFETACIIRGVPYARKGASSFLGSPETKALLSYVQLVTGTDSKKMQAALSEALNKPNRFFLKDPGKTPEAVEAAVSKYARLSNQDSKSVNPVRALADARFIRILAEELAKLTRTGKGFKFEERLDDLGAELSEMQARSTDPTYETKDLFDDILGLKGTANVGGQFVDQSFRESLQTSLRNALGDDEGGEDDDDGEDTPDDGTKGLGNISFLYQLAKVDPTDDDDATNSPTTPLGFKAKMERYAGKMRDLRTDLTSWYREQNSLPPEKRSPPPGAYIGTVHSVKGAQWPNTFVSMPKGKFPMMPPKRPGQPPPPPELMARQLQDERRLAYVALTRAGKNLTIVCPQTVGGLDAGVSQFVSEAGLKMGENVTTRVTESTESEEGATQSPKEARLFKAVEVPAWALEDVG